MSTPTTCLPPEVRQHVTALLCDADDSLFPSEAAAFQASVEVTNRFLAEHGIDRRVTAEELRTTRRGRTSGRRHASWPRRRAPRSPTSTCGCRRSNVR
jgi:hypothetical protein